MKYFIKAFFIVVILITSSLLKTETLAKNTNFKYSQEDISNYFSGIVSLNQNYTTTGFKYLNKVQSLRNTHSNFNIQFIRSLILLEKFDQAFAFSKSVWREDEPFFDIDLLLGLESFVKKDYINAEKYFKRLNAFSKYNLFFDDFFGNLLTSWIEASKNNQEGSFKFLNEIPERYIHLKNIQRLLTMEVDGDSSLLDIAERWGYNFIEIYDEFCRLYSVGIFTDKKLNL